MVEAEPKTETARTHPPAKRPGVLQMALSALGAFAGLGAVALVEQWWLGGDDLSLMIGSFGASAVLLYAAASSPLAQPYNLVVGHIVSAIVGVAVFQALGEASWLSIALAGALAIFAMQLTRSLHPPGGATALIAVIGSDAVHALGFTYVLFPVALGAVIMLAVALITNNVPVNRPRGKPWPQLWHPFS